MVTEVALSAEAAAQARSSRDEMRHTACGSRAASADSAFWRDADLGGGSGQVKRTATKVSSEHVMFTTSTQQEEGRESDDKPPPADCGLRRDPYADLAVTALLDQPQVQESAWDDWQWQMRNRIRSVPQLLRRFPGLGATQGIEEAARRFPLAITPYYASLIRRLDAGDPVFRMAVPDAAELSDPAFLEDDPLSEDRDMPVRGLVHRYRGRALIIATTACATYCRHCTRKRVAGQTESCLSAIRLAQVTEYLSVHPEIHDVIISGGDPFTMKTDVLERAIRAVRAVPSVEIIRIGTRTPVVLPMRITDELVDMLRKYHPVYVNTHFNHPAELTPDAEAACARLADAGIPLGNQTVLLRGVNDDPLLLADLFRRLVRTRVRPYYLFQCDLVRGVEHFRTPLSKGIEIMEYLRGRLSGLAIPSFVVDAPHGGGKIPLLPNYMVSSSPTHTVLRNFAGEMASYPEPRQGCDVPAADADPPVEPGVWGLATGRATRARQQPPLGSRATPSSDPS
jgi:lysine 2,3-aminomutase